MYLPVRYLTPRRNCRTIGVLATVYRFCLCDWPAMEATPEAKRQAAKVIKALARDYADAECALNFDSPVQLLVATILSARLVRFEKIALVEELNAREVVRVVLLVGQRLSPLQRNEQLQHIPE